MWTIQTKHIVAPGRPQVYLIVHSDDRTDDRVLELSPDQAIDLAVELLNAATDRME